ncbi:MAG: MFS transporter, partial [Candidatus Viridilinea halotolerans]
TIYRIIFGLAAFIALLALLPLRLPLSTSPSARPLAGRRRLRRKKSVWGTAPTAAFRATALKFMRMGLRPRQPGALLVAELRQLLYWSRYAIPFVFSPLFISCGAALLIPFLNIYFRQRFDAPDAALGLIFAAIGVATGAATLLAPWLAHHLGYMGSVVVTQALAIPCLLLLAAASNLWLAAGIALVRGALMNMASPLYEAYAMERTPEAARPLVIGLINGAFSLGYIVGPSISAQVQRDYGFGPLFAATAILYACGAAVNYMLFVKK